MNLPQEPVFADGVYVYSPSGGYGPALVLSDFLTNAHFNGPAAWRTQWDRYETRPDHQADATVDYTGGVITLGLNPDYFGQPDRINNSFVRMLRESLPAGFAPAAPYIDQGASLIHELAHIFNTAPYFGGSRIRDDAGNSIRSGANQAVVYNNCVRPLFPMIAPQDENPRPIVLPMVPLP